MKQIPVCKSAAYVLFKEKHVLFLQLKRMTYFCRVKFKNKYYDEEINVHFTDRAFSVAIANFTKNSTTDAVSFIAVIELMNNI